MESLHKITSFTNYFYDLSTFLSSVILDVVFLEILNGSKNFHDTFCSRLFKLVFELNVFGYFGLMSFTFFKRFFVLF